MNKLATIDVFRELPYALRALWLSQFKAGTQAAIEVGSPVINYLPSRVIMQDFSAVPVFIDFLAETENSGQDEGKRPELAIPVEVYIDHSAINHSWGSVGAAEQNLDYEYETNRERFQFLKWFSETYSAVTVSIPGGGIIHHRQLESDARFITADGYPELVLGTDSHTTMINALGIPGWGLGGLDAVLFLLGRPGQLRIPEVVLVELVGRRSPGVSSADLALTLTEALREFGVVDKIIEFGGASLRKLDVFDRATISNMCPEYGANMAFFPFDDATSTYVATSRGSEFAQALTHRWQDLGLFFESDPVIKYSHRLVFDLSKVEPVVSGPDSPQQRVPLSHIDGHLRERWLVAEKKKALIAIASIASCTNSGNPRSLIRAALVARKARRIGLRIPDWVQTTFSPGSPEVSRRLDRLGLLNELEGLGFAVSSYGCSTCVGNTAPLDPRLVDDPRFSDGERVAVISGNRNFPGRLGGQVDGIYLASPELVVVFAVAGSLSLQEMDHGSPNAISNLATLLLPSDQEVQELLSRYQDDTSTQNVTSFQKLAKAKWDALTTKKAGSFAWDEESIFLKRPEPYRSLPSLDSLPEGKRGFRCLLALGDDVSTDMISPAGKIVPDSLAGQYLASQKKDVLSLPAFGAFRGNRDVMNRGGFSNPRLHNRLRSGLASGTTVVQPTGEVLPTYEAAAHYRQNGTPLLIVAGKNYGCGSSRDWAAKVTRNFGVRIVLAKSFERIHRRNLVTVGVLPCVLSDELTVTPEHSFFFSDLEESVRSGKLVVHLVHENGESLEVEVTPAIQGPEELDFVFGRR